VTHSSDAQPDSACPIADNATTIRASSEHRPTKINPSFPRRAGAGLPSETHKGSHISARITSRHRDSRNGDLWCDDDFHIMESRRVVRYCLLDLSSTLNTGLLTSENESQGPNVKTVRVFPLRRDPSRVLVKLTLVANKCASLVTTGTFGRITSAAFHGDHAIHPDDIGLLPTLMEGNRRLTPVDQWGGQKETDNIQTNDQLDSEWKIVARRTAIVM